MGMYPGGNIIRVTPTVIAGTTHNDDVMFDATAIPNATSSRGGVSKITGIFVVDKDNEAHDLDLVFLKTQVNLGDAGSAVDISDANLADNLIGALQQDQGDTSMAFVTSTVSYIGEFDATGAGTGALPMLIQSAGGSTDVYFSAIARQETAFGATNDLTFIFHIEYIS